METDTLRKKFCFGYNNETFSDHILVMTCDKNEGVITPPTTPISSNVFVTSNTPSPKRKTEDSDEETTIMEDGNPRKKNKTEDTFCEPLIVISRSSSSSSSSSCPKRRNKTITNNLTTSSDSIVHLNLNSKFEHSSESFSKIVTRQSATEAETIETETEQISNDTCEGYTIVDETPSEEDKILVNSLVLSAQSPVFYALFANGMKESKLKEISIQVSKSNRPYFRDLIRFLYTGEFLTTGVDLLRILILADQYQIDSAIQESSKQLGNSFKDVKACCEVVDFLGNFPSNGAFGPIIAHCRNYLYQQFSDFDDDDIQTKFVEELASPRSVAIVLTNNEMKVGSENTVFQVVKRWLLHDSTRIAHASFLLPFIRYYLMTHDFLRCVVLNNDIFNTFNLQLLLRVKDIIAQAISYSMSTPDRQRLLCSLQDGVRKKLMHKRAVDDTRIYKSHFVDINLNFDNHFETPCFFVHGYYLYLRFEKSEQSATAVAQPLNTVSNTNLVMLLNLNYQKTGIVVNQHLTTMHFKLFFRDPKTKQYMHIHTIEKHWVKSSTGKGTKIQLPSQFVHNNTLSIQLDVALGPSKR